MPDPPSKIAEFPIPPELDAAILECLAKQPDERPESARALARKLGAIPVEPWTEEQAERWWRTHRPATSATEANPHAPADVGAR